MSGVLDRQEVIAVLDHHDAGSRIAAHAPSYRETLADAVIALAERYVVPTVELMGAGAAGAHVLRAAAAEQRRLAADALEQIRARAAAAHRGPWTWRGNVDTRQIYLSYTKPGLGWTSVMDFTRWGMQSARPRFLTDEFWMKDADELAVFEVCRDATRRSDPRVYRGDIVGFRHPDAEFIASARQDVDDLLAIIDAIRVRAESWIDDMEHATDERCIEGPGCPCCHARDILSILDIERPAVRPGRGDIVTLQVAGEVL